MQNVFWKDGAQKKAFFGKMGRMNGKMGRKKHEKTRVGKSCDIIDLNNQFHQKFH
jgi:hypothetical protein